MRRTDSRDSNVRQVWTRFFLYSFGVFLVYSAYGTLLSLQSSINVVSGLGTTGLATIYISAVSFLLLCAPAILRKYDAKKCVCFSEITYIFYIAANFRPTFYTIIPASILVGMGDSILWSCFPIMNSFFANLYSSASDKSLQTRHETRFSGYFFAVFQLAKLPGNLISYAVLYGFNSELLLDDNATLLLLNGTELNSSTKIDHDYSHCGASDCQEPEQVDNAIDQYVPASDWAIYALLIVMCLLCIIAIIVHFIFIPSTNEFLIARRKRSSGSVVGLPKNASKTLLVRQSSSASEIDKLADTNNNEEPKIDKEVTIVLEKEEAEEKSKKQESSISYALTTAKDVAIQLVELKQLLLMPMIYYSGVAYGFITSELTRSYTSCIFGVAWVPIHAICYGIGAGFVCFVSGKLSKRLSRSTLITIATLFDIAGYSYALFLDPNAATHVSVIPLYFVLGGMTGGIWIPTTQVLQVVTFPDRLDVSSPVWNFWFMSGIATTFACSTSMCVNVKIYVQLGILFVSLVGYGISERIRKRENSQESKIKFTVEGE